MLAQRIGFIGAGRMASALGRGLIEAGLVSPDYLVAADPSGEARQRFAQATGGKTVEDGAAVAAECDVVVLAVKPQQLAEVAPVVAGSLGPATLVVSILAGVRLSRLARALGERVRLVRVMPNTPCLVREGASGFCLGPQATREDAALVRRLLESVGIAVEVEEDLLDVVTGLSGSGPAFACVVIEALRDAATALSLPRDLATRLAAQTLRGAATMVLADEETPEELRDRVTSPGGTTMAGLAALEAAGLRDALAAAVKAATRRSIELGEG